MTDDEVGPWPTDGTGSDLPGNEATRNPRKIDSGPFERPARQIHDGDDLGESPVATIPSVAPLYVPDTWENLEDLQAACRASRGMGNKIRACWRAGRLLAKKNRLREASEEFSHAVELLRQLVIETADRESQERQLVHHTELVAEAVAVAIDAERKELAVELFENGRGLLAPQRGGTTVGVLGVEEIRQAAANGPIVMINISDYGSDAIIVRQSGITPIELQGLTREFVDMKWVSFEDAVTNSETLDQFNAAVQKCLNWLWRAFVDPMANELGLFDHSGSESRVWWIPTGPLVFLPLHAAERAKARDADAVSLIDLITSSYAPSVRALLRPRPSEEWLSFVRMGKLLLISMPETPGKANLPFARQEVSDLEEKISDTYPMIGSRAAKDEILARLPAYEWAHFSCHSDSDLINPSSSNLVVAHGQTLTVLEIAEKLDAGGALAFLAACGTSRSGMGMTDEAIHLAGAFQLAGYRHVISTMWRIRDDVALDLSRHFYAELLIEPESTERSAVILRNSIRELRKRYPGSPALWASYIHFGS